MKDYRHEKNHGQYTELPLLCSHETPPGVLHSALGHPEQEGHGPITMSTDKGLKDDQGAGAPLL